MKRASEEIVSFNLLNEPASARAEVLELLDAWFSRWLADPVGGTRCA